LFEILYHLVSDKNCNVYKNLFIIKKNFSLFKVKPAVILSFIKPLFGNRNFVNNFSLFPLKIKENT